MRIIAGYSSVELTHAVCRDLNTLPLAILRKRFADGEISISTSEELHGGACLLIHSLSEPVNDSVMTLLLTIDALKRSGAGKITVCLPYLAYTRQNHTASLIVSLMHAAGAHQCITIDPHLPIESAMIPITVLQATQLFADHIKATQGVDNLVIVAPDQGGITRCMHVHEMLGLKSDLVCIDKIRMDDICSVRAIHGDVRGKRCIIVDDIIDTGTTLCSAAEALTGQGAAEVFAYCTHAVLSGMALDRVQHSVIKKLMITDTIVPRQDVLNAPKIEIMSVASLLAKHFQ
ncbi:MAG: ribose-phosphate diphosphokinase [Pseudomonadota bacterium]